MPEDSRFPLSEAFEYLLGLHPAGWTLREHARDTIRKLATSGNVILVGRAGAIITADLPRVLHVRLIAPFEFRVKDYALSQRISEKQAAKAVLANDRASRKCVRSYFNTNVRDQSHYDLIINTETNGFESTAHIVCTALQHFVTRDRIDEGLPSSVERT
jgi:cytidylate kinase